ncbi:ankyrin repeat-containing protein ITN1-like [Syzygium oleosum]|uniref:ankyrin repeat-containing protein ITN1-like n=1 Tax=Syzygium oleosum TaxID=219896 RepID=UPI0024BB0571|nr:ankyrin repeat-containing protein ITN1-like [Syzygium oleosum]XP_056162938.1 ankyrin repeat-containing protein ITN1-like [Syzygium oleosum]XP_056162939.1 ankyrin repeat-containing protein ITN1-like [Syzygium oleosum]XP_056162940.1 ankyrin repeat-containing protein ITN1-like [Syzygium oleosum]
MDVKLSIEEEGVGMKKSIPEEAKKDERGASVEMLEDETDFLKEEEIWRRRRERLKNALAAVRTAAGQDPEEVYAAAEELAVVIKSADVEGFISAIEKLADRTDLSAVLNTLEPWNRSLLHHAADASNDDILRFLLDCVGDHLIAAQDDWGDTPLHLVARHEGSTRAAEMLIRRARDLPNVEDKNQILRMKNKLGNTALHIAVQRGNVEVVRYLLNEDLEPVYWKNAGQKSPLYLAIESNDSAIHDVLFSLSLEPSKIEGLPPIHGAIMRSNRDLVAKILEKNVKLFAMTDSRGSNVFHLAASTFQSHIFELLGPKTEHLARQWDMNGDLPIHIASKMDNVYQIEKLHLVSRFPNGQGRTVLHVAAKYGRASTVKYILRHPELGEQINAIDHDGNTPLHLAAMYSQPAALIALLLDERIELAVSNNKCLTAVDIARERWAGGLTIRKQFVWMALACLCIGKVSPVSRDLIIFRPEVREKEYAGLVRSRKKMPDRNIVNDSIDSRMVVATLVATVTFAAGFAVPGGFNSSDTASKDDRGMATMLDNRMFQAFAICNTIAMFCSMTVVVNLIWMRSINVHIAITAYECTTLPLKIALPAMSAAFLTGVTLTVGKLPWLANTIFYLGLIFVLIISVPRLLEYPTLFMICGRRIGRLTFWLILAYIYLWRLGTYIYDDTEDDGTASETSASQPADGAGELKTDDRPKKTKNIEDR